MTNVVDILFKTLSMSKETILRTGKLKPLKYCIISSPDMMTKVFTEKN